MSPSKDRVAAPTNGHRPAMTHPEVDTHLVESTEVARGEPASAVPSVSPVQLAAGFGIVVAVILFLLGRRRGSRD